MIWVAFLPFLVSCAHGNRTVEQVPFFHGHVFENSSPGSRVYGLSVPLKRLNSERLCGTGEFAAHFKLLGDGSVNFRVFAHNKRGHILLKTSAVLDREDRGEYALSLGLCCGQCAGLSREVEEQSPVVTEVASIKVDVLDTNDHQPTFTGNDVKLSLDDATALRTAIYTVTARDGDSGKNAELIYFALPRNGSFYAVPKTGDILLVDSILGLDEPIKFKVFARDRGWPPRTSQGKDVEINPHQWPVAPSLNTQQGGSQIKVPARRSRSVLESDSPVLINVSEDAGIGSVVMNLNPVRFQAAAFELVEPDAESSPVSVSRDSGDIVISRKLDRETEPLVEISVKVQDKRGERTRGCVCVCVCVFERESDPLCVRERKSKIRCLSNEQNIILFLYHLF
ncbi:Protocadherin Fat 4 [Dissostichus eleginoides]|uniref:Protocadherin Fat 4 n=1 Tax=Dissostichus eleginoides TaxID=100907 RepID=A0AAD9F7K6_DISEL|nr:Protocadherin Fat 4 [Dissostichus eleginoides]